MITELDLIADGVHPDRASEIARIENGGSGCTHGGPALDDPVVAADELAELDNVDDDLP